MIYQIVHYAINKKGQLFAFYNNVQTGVAISSQIGASTDWTDVSGCSILEYTEDTYTINSVIDYATGIQAGVLYQISGLTINPILSDSDWTTSNGIIANSTDNTPIFAQKIDPLLVTATIIPNPYNSTVTISATGYNTVTGTGPQSIDVMKGTTITYTVEAYAYSTKTRSATITTNQDINVILKPALELSDYLYTDNNGYVTLIKYIGAGGGIITPNV